MNCSAIDVRRASLVQIQVGVLEHERAGDTPNQWPAEVRRQVGKYLAEWRVHHPDRAVLCTRAIAIPGQCTFELYHVHQSELAPPVPRRARSAPPRSAMPAAAPQCQTCGDR